MGNVFKITNEWLDMTEISPQERLSKIQEKLKDLPITSNCHIAHTMKQYLLSAKMDDANFLKSHLMKSDGLNQTRVAHEYMLRRLMTHKNVTTRLLMLETDNIVPTSENPTTKESAIEILNAIEVIDMCIAVMLWDYSEWQ